MFGCRIRLSCFLFTDHLRFSHGPVRRGSPPLSGLPAMPQYQKRLRGYWCDELAVDANGFVTLRCRCCEELLIGWKTAQACKRRHWPRGPVCQGRLALHGSTHSPSVPPSHQAGSPASSGSPRGEEPKPVNEPDDIPQVLSLPSLTFSGTWVAKRFDGDLYYGQVLGLSSELVLEGTELTEQWVVLFDDGKLADFTRAEIEAGAELYR